MHLKAVRYTMVEKKEPKQQTMHNRAHVDRTLAILSSANQQFPRGCQEFPQMIGK